MNFTDIIDKLELMKQYCIEQSELDCGILEHKEYSINSYTVQFGDLIFNIETYLNDANAVRTKQMIDLITMDFVNDLISDINYDPPIHRLEEPYPVGYENYWDLFGANGLLQSILNYDNDYYYEGCILDPDFPPEIPPIIPEPEPSEMVTTPKLQTDISLSENAEGVESANRDLLIAWLRSVQMLNHLIYLTEDFTITGTAKQKQEVGINIYTGKHAAEIIQSFELNVYIPSYI